MVPNAGHSATQGKVQPRRNIKEKLTLPKSQGNLQAASQRAAVAWGDASLLLSPSTTGSGYQSRLGWG